MKIIIKIFLFFYFLFGSLNAETEIDSNLKEALESLYYYSPKLKYERKILMSKDKNQNKIKPTAPVEEKLYHCCKKR